MAKRANITRKAGGTIEADDSMLLSFGAAARVLGLSERTLHTMVKCKEVPHVRVRRLVKFSPDSLKQWIKERETPVSAHCVGTQSGAA